jgi:hypothetical protein
MTYKQLIDKIHLLGCYEDQVKLQSLHDNIVFKIVSFHEADKDNFCEGVEKGDTIFDIEMNNY